MDIYINNKLQQLREGARIYELLSAINVATHNGLALAVNNAVVPRDEWENYELRAEDKITLIKATQGG